MFDDEHVFAQEFVRERVDLCYCFSALCPKLHVPKVDKYNINEGWAGCSPAESGLKIWQDMEPRLQNGGLGWKLKTNFPCLRHLGFLFFFFNFKQTRVNQKLPPQSRILSCPWKEGVGGRPDGLELCSMPE